jgi:phospholipid/cholesterol/gamma-HCH transport system ATP-binding protein
MSKPEHTMVEIKGLWTVFKTSDAEFVVHKNLDLTIARGEVLSLVGGSGTGKTVLLRQILGLEQPARGTVTVLGQPVGQRVQPHWHAVPARRAVLGFQRAGEHCLSAARA